MIWEFQTEVDWVPQEGDVMTTISMIYDRNLICGFEMLGHAGYSKNGEPDIVCSALSSTSQMTINAILDWTGLSLEDVKCFKQDAKQGHLLFLLNDTYYNGLVTQQLLNAFHMYTDLLEQTYPDNIKKERREIYDYTDK